MWEPDISNGVLTLPEDCYALEPSQFANYDSFSEIRWPSHPVELGEESFYGCTSLTHVTLPEGTKSLPMGVFAACIGITSVELPESLEEVGDSAFMFCSALGEVKVPGNVKRVGKTAFFGSGLRSVSMPASVEEVDERAFANCNSLRHVDLYNDAAALGASAIFADPPEGAGDALDFISLLGFQSECNICEGYLKAGLPVENNDPRFPHYAEMWATCPEKHDAATGERMKVYIAGHELEFVKSAIVHHNVAAVRTLVEEGLLSTENKDTYVRLSTEEGVSELTALLLTGPAGNAMSLEEEFSL